MALVCKYVFENTFEKWRQMTRDKMARIWRGNGEENLAKKDIAGYISPVGPIPQLLSLLNEPFHLGS